MQVPAPFDYARATSVDDALALLDRLGPEARLIAGGQSLLPMMKLRLASPEHLVDINPLDHELRYIRAEGGGARGGARTPHVAPPPPPPRPPPPCRSSATPSRRSPTRRCATAARSAARSR